MSHALHLAERPSPARITAYAGVIALHAAAFVLLLMPMSPPATKAIEETVIPIIFEKKIEKKPIVEPERQDKIKPQPTTKPREQRVEQPPIVVDVGEDVAPPQQPIDDATIIETVQPPITGPLRTDNMTYAVAPPPAYPRDALARRIEGTVYLEVLVDVDGTPLDVRVQTSSGNRSLDEAARKHVLKRWMFRPAMQDGRAVQAIGVVPMRFVMR